MVHQHPHPVATAPEHLQGSVEQVTSHSPESGFCVLQVKVRGTRELVTIIGQTKTLAMAVKRLGSVKPLTNLQARLRQAVEGDQCAEPHTRS